MSFVLAGHFEFFFFKYFFLLHSHENKSKFLAYQEWVEILMITLFSSQKSLPPNISACSVHHQDLKQPKAFENYFNRLVKSKKKEKVCN